MLPTEVIEIWNKTRNKKKFQIDLEVKGFKYIGCGKRSTVLSREDIDYVIKISDCGCVTRRFREPTLEQFRLPYIYTNGNRCIGIQKKAEVTPEGKYRAYEKILSEIPIEIDLYDFDVHQDNVGWLNGKPVIFDHT